MCGRVVVGLPDLGVLVRRFGVRRVMPMRWRPRYNLAPTQLAPVITSERELGLFRFGLIPSWAKDPRIANKLINARVETVARLPAFRSAFAARRCIVPVTGYYEWRKAKGATHKTPFFIHREDGDVLPLAGVWERFVPSEGEAVLSFALITRPASGIVAEIHDRMPLLLPAAEVPRWLSPGQLDASALDATVAASDDVAALQAHEVSSIVNSPKHDGPECIALTSNRLQAD